jgi:multiple sugar transport system substrate-binding protein
MGLKKTAAWLISLSLVLGAASGCAKGTASGTQGAQSSGKETAKKPIHLKFWGGVPPESGPQAVVDAWNKQNPDIQVDYVRYVNDDDGNLKLDTALLTGQDVDLYVNYTIPRLQKRVEAGVALDLSKYGDYNIEDKMGPGAKEWQIGNKYYALPTKRNIYFVWLNKDALDKAGLPIPFDWTWKDMQNYAAKLKTDKRYGLVQHLEVYADPMDAALAGEGYVKPDGTSNLNNPLAGTYLDILNTMMKDGKSTPPLGEQLSTKMPVETTFLKGDAAMLNAGEWIFRNANDLKTNPRDFKIAFAPVPRLAQDPQHAKQRGGLGDAISINAKSPNADAAWKFLKWYADGGMMPMASGGRIPSSKAVNQEEAMKLLLGDAAGTYDQDSLKKVVFGQFDTFNTSLPQQVIDLRREEYEKFLLGKQDLKTTLEAMAKRHNEYLKQNKK